MPAFSPAYGYYDVTTYFHTGDPDWTAAIQRAENACETTGGVVYFPPGTYLISATITVSSGNVTWRGTGAGSSTIELSTGSGTTTPMVTVAADIDNIIFIGLTFQGNNANNGSGGAPGADAITIGTSGGSTNHFCKVLDCFFTATTPGPTLHFWNTTDGEVSRCRFYQVGFDNGTNSDSDITPAVLIEPNSINVRVHSNHFEQCFYDGVRVQGTACEVSYNYFNQCHGSSIDIGSSTGAGNGARLFGNYINGTQHVGTGTTGQGINLSAVENFQVIGNSVTSSDGNGMTINSCASGALVGNLCFDNNYVSSAGNAGVAYTAGTVGSNPNQGLTFVGNVCFDDGANKQSYGMDFAASGGTASDLTLVGNSYWGNTSSDIQIDASVFVDDSNVAIANCSWLDRQHLSSWTTTGFSVKLPLFGSNIGIAADSMRTTHGLRIVAGGSTNGLSGHTGPRTFYLGLNTSGNLMTYTSSNANTDWQLIAYVMNNAAFGHQRSFVQFWFGGILVYHASVTTSVGTASPTTVLVEALLNDPLDLIEGDFLVIERV